MRPIRCCAIALLAVAANAFADEDELARSHFQTGVVYFDRGEYRKALREFMEARAAAPRAEFDYNIGKAYENLGDAARAVRWYKSYLAARPNAADATETRNAIERLGRRVGAIALVGVEPGARVLLDGEPVEREPDGRLAATEGPHLLRVERDTAAPVTVTVLVAAGSEISASLSPVPAPAPPPPPAPAPEVSPVAVAPTPPPSEPAPRSRWKLWLGLGVAAAVVVVGVVILAAIFSGSSTDYQAQAMRNCPGCPIEEFR